MKIGFRLALLLLGVMLFLSACGGGSDSESGSVAGGGIGGTGEGTVTATTAGSIEINNFRTFQISSATEITVDGQPATEADLISLGTGLVAQVDVANDVSGDFTSGSALAISVRTLVKGPVTSIAPQLEVLGQSVVTTGDTVLELNGLASVGALAEGYIVEVSGYADAGNVIQATRLEYKASGTPVWKLVGPVSNLDPGISFTIGTQVVDYTGVTPEDCAGGLANGDKVEVKAAEDAGFTSGQDLNTVTRVECIQPGLVIPPGASGILVAEIEGIIDNVDDPTHFSVRGQQVVTTASTNYEDGSASDIAPGVKVEVEGLLDTSTGILTASEVEFRETRVRIIAPVNSGDIDSVAGTLVILGIPVQSSALTRDDDGVIPGTLDNRDIEVRGFVDGMGTVFATEIRDSGNFPGGDPDKVRLRGPVLAFSIDEASQLFQILGVNIDVRGVELFGYGTEAEFFAALTTELGAEVEDGAYDGIDTISNGPGSTVIHIED